MVKKERFKSYMRTCTRCGRIYTTPARQGKVCENCKKDNKTSFSKVDLKTVIDDDVPL